MSATYHNYYSILHRNVPVTAEEVIIEVAKKKKKIEFCNLILGYNFSKQRVSMLLNYNDDITLYRFENKSHPLILWLGIRKIYQSSPYIN